METINDLLNYNGLKIVQNTDWFKFSLDSVLLANFVNVNKKTKIINLRLIFKNFFILFV